MPIVSVILDGENAWEYYPYNGYYFLTELYSRLEAHPLHPHHHLRRMAGRARARPGHMPRPGTFPVWSRGAGSTAIWPPGSGRPEKNHAWDLLAQAKQSYDLVMASGRLTEREQEAASVQLASCESSDWFWWFGDYNPARLGGELRPALPAESRAPVSGAATACPRGACASHQRRRR